MKNKLILCAALLFAALSCTKIIEVYQDEFGNPAFSSVTVESGEKSAILSATITDDGGQLISERGFYWSDAQFSTSGNPNATKISSGRGKGMFTQEIPGLEAGTDYWACAYAVNGNGAITCSEVIKFSTLASAGIKLLDARITDIGYHASSETYNFRVTARINVSQADRIQAAYIFMCNHQWDISPLEDGESDHEVSSLAIPDDGITTGVTPYALLKNGNEFYGNTISVKLDAKGIKGDIALLSNYVDWYSEPEHNFYNHVYRVKQSVISGASNIAKLGFYTSYDYKNREWILDDSPLYDGRTLSSTLNYTTDNPKMSIYPVGLAWFGTGSDRIRIIGSNDLYDINNNYLEDYSFETFFYEPFSAESAKFEVKNDATCSWTHDSENGVMKACGSSGGGGEAWLISKEIDLSDRSNAILQFRSETVSFDGTAEQAFLKISTDNGKSWTDVQVENFSGSANAANSYVADLSQWYGKKIRYAFVYKGNSAGTGIWKISSASVYVVTSTGQLVSATVQKSNVQKVSLRKMLLKDSSENINKLKSNTL
ncbi:MAG: choice-of-anchor J domain-containing protein [Bacteroidales bacterium]|nr:choice-of-anchor J domain-containing protein [Candidatus Cacconaster equi]